MRRLTSIVYLAILCGSMAWLSAYSYVGFEQITVAAAAIGFTTAKITPPGRPEATIASCRLETAEIRWRIDGLPGSATVGTLLEPGDILTVTGHDALVTFSAFRTGATSGQLDCNYSAP
jgi:hypothetical protein